MRRLELAGIVDELCPVRDVAELTHGQVIEAMVANRLSAPAPLVGLGKWASAWAVEEVFGIAPALLNDDRAAAALDAIAPHLAEIVGSVGTAAIAGFGIDVARLHWDMTRCRCSGTMSSRTARSRRSATGIRRKQVQAGIAVSGDGWIPIFHRAYDGGAAEVSQIVGAMSELKKMAGSARFLLAGDSKLISHGNVGAMIDAGVQFSRPGRRSEDPAGVPCRAKSTP